MSCKYVFQFFDLFWIMLQCILVELCIFGDWGELYGKFGKEDVQFQVGCCLDCGNLYCSWKCLVYNVILQWLQLVQENCIYEVVMLCYFINLLLEVCGWVCLQDCLCEGSCMLEEFGVVIIGVVEKYIVDMVLVIGWCLDLSVVEVIGRCVVVIGVGLVGLVCVDKLVYVGVQVVVYDCYEQIGGLLQFGIFSFKLDKVVISCCCNVLEGMGVQFWLGVEIGCDISVDQLLVEYDVVFIGIGVYCYIDGGLFGQDFKGVLLVLLFLVQNSCIVGGSDVYGWFIVGWEDQIVLLDLEGKWVVVFGGGDIGMDCVCSVVCLGVVKVICVYCCDEVNMFGLVCEVVNVCEEGVCFLFNCQLLLIEVGVDDEVIGVMVVEIQFGEFDVQGCCNVVLIDGSEFLLEVDVVIIVFGFLFSMLVWLVVYGVEVGQNGCIVVGGVGWLLFQIVYLCLFVGGDVVCGVDLVVIVVVEGCDVVVSIVQFVIV